MSIEHPDKPKPSKAPSERTVGEVFWWTALPAFMALTVVTTILPHWMGFSNGGLVYPMMMLSRCIAVWNCRRVGVSRQESCQEIIERDPRATLAPFLSEAPVFELGRSKRPRACVNRDSISGHSSGSAWTRVLWSDVGSCVVMARRDVFGNPSYCHILLRGHDNITPLFQSQLSQADDATLLPAIRFYLRAESPGSPTST